MQEYNRIEDTEYISDAPSQLNKNMESIATDFSGASFPTENLFVGMKCLRTDENKIYRLYENASNQLVWQLEYTIVAGGIKVKEADDLPASKYATQAEAEGAINNTKIMTPKGVDYRLKKDRSLKTYTSFEQLGLSSTATLLEVVNAMPKESQFTQYIGANTYEAFGVPQPGIVTIVKAQGNNYANLWHQRYGGNNIVRKAWFENWGSGQTEFLWKEVLSSDKFSTQAQAEAGIDNSTAMTPLSTKQVVRKFYDVESLGLNRSTVTFTALRNAMTQIGSNGVELFIYADANIFPNLSFPKNLTGSFYAKNVENTVLCEFVASATGGHKVYRCKIISSGATPWEKLAYNGALSMPSDVAVNISYTNFGQEMQYVAPVDGYVCLRISNTKNSAYIFNITNQHLIAPCSPWSSDFEITRACFCPVAKNDVVAICVAKGANIDYCNFIYAQSEV